MRQNTPKLLQAFVGAGAVLVVAFLAGTIVMARVGLPMTLESLVFVAFPVAVVTAWFGFRNANDWVVEGGMPLRVFVAKASIPAALCAAASVWIGNAVALGVFQRTELAMGAFIPAVVITGRVREFLNRFPGFLWEL